MKSNIALRPRIAADGCSIEWVAENVPEHEVRPPAITYNISQVRDQSLADIASALLFQARVRGARA